MEKKQRIKVKLAFILFALTVMFLALSLRIVYLKTAYGEQYETAAKTQQVSRYDVMITPNRGSIVDRNKQALALSTTVYNVVLDTRVLTEYNAEEQEKTIKALSETLGLDYNTLKDYITINSATGRPNLDTNWKVLAKQQSRETKESLEAMELKGVVYEKESKRKYTTDTLAAQVIGFIRDTLWGLESSYNSEMSGIAGRSFLTYDGSSGAVGQEYPAQDGNTIVTTLDYTIQLYAQQAVEQAMKEYNPKNAAAIVMNPNTGEILAMAQSPTLNLNDPTNPIYLTDEAFASDWDTMTNEQQYEFLNTVWKNYNVSSTFEPGSIFKPITVAAALEEGIITNDDTYYCGGSKTVADRVIGCHLRSGHGMLTTKEALAQSCNVAMMEIAAKMGAQTFYDYQKNFGFGEKTGIDLPAEASAASLMYSPSQIKSVELATMSFGQSFNCTSLQIINAFSAIVNGGNLMRPYVVSQVIDTNGNVIREIKPEVIRKVISQEVSDIVRTDLISTIEIGTGKKAKIQGYTFGGKTGTSQQRRNEAVQKYTISFIGFLPADNPQYIAITLINEPESYADGVTTAAPMIKGLFENIIKYKSIEPSYETEESAKANSSTKSVVEDYTGMNIMDVLSDLDAKDLEYEVAGLGSVVVNQVPHGVAEVDKGSKVTLYVTKAESDTGNIPVPDVRGMAYDEAVSAIMDAGLEIVVNGDENDTVAVRQSPSHSVTVEKGHEITVYFEPKPEDTQE